MEKNMNSIKLEYLWLDGYETPNIRSKAKYIDFDSSTFGFSSGEEFQLENVPEWGFDGSSTEQADGGDSDCILKPVSILSRMRACWAFKSIKAMLMVCVFSLSDLGF